MNIAFSSKSITWIVQFLNPYLGRLFIYFFSELCSLAGSLAFIYYSKQSIDLAVGGDTTRLYVHIIGMLFSLLMGVVMSLVGQWYNEQLKARMLLDLQQQLVKAQMAAEWSAVGQFKTGDILNRIQVDGPEAVQVFCSTFVAILITLMKLLSAFIFLWWMDSSLAFIILGLSPFVLVSKIYYKRLKALHVELKTEESSLSHHLQENLRLRLPVRALNLQEWRWQMTLGHQQSVYALRLKLLSFSILSRSIVSVISNVGFIVAFLWGIRSLYYQEISFGTMSAFLQLVARIQGPMIALMAYVPQLIRFRATVDRLVDAIQVDMESPLVPTKLDHVKSISFDQVNFGYEDQLVIHNFSAQFVRGRATAIIGSSGQGKTTLIRLLLCLIKPSAGHISLTAGDQSYLLDVSHRPNFAYVPQGDKLFSGTIRENIYAGSIVSDEAIEHVLELACASFVKDLPEGLDTKVGEGAFGLSEGQAQRIAVARALLSDAPIWLFDEITSALDPATGLQLMQNILKAGRDKILIFVTHDLELGNMCDQIIHTR